MAALLPYLAMAGATALPKVGEGIGDFAKGGLKKVGSLLGFKKGGSIGNSVHHAMHMATVRNTGIRTIHPHDLVIPAKLAGKLKQVAKRKPQPVRKKAKAKPKKKCKCKRKH
jgi:hypothetical protein